MLSGYKKQASKPSEQASWDELDFKIKRKGISSHMNTQTDRHTHTTCSREEGGRGESCWIQLLK